ncbi:hypothetical protein B0H63DRAFT_454804 [Podospora didyma]|uniref:Ecp2 effector protein domain-containing protein n=1 Tax=Podospora didyma TaxID=330526 RepID=A0AAE0N551_9PEZI|nr:hypothetical protein B0H63DRAFT_454804 [Podospora didyma]
MLSNTLLALCALASASMAAATPVAPEAIAACGETAAKVCFGTNGGTAQNVDPEDVAFAAASLRYIGQSNTGDAAFWNMPKSIDCEEWMLPVSNGGTVLALAKHINQRVNSSILFEDLANAIDGGEDASAAAIKGSLLGCGAAGGMVGVKANTANPLYNTAAYKASGAKPDGILIKIVRAPV